MIAGKQIDQQAGIAVGGNMEHKPGFRLDAHRILLIHIAETAQGPLVIGPAAAHLDPGAEHDFAVEQ